MPPSILTQEEIERLQIQTLRRNVDDCDEQIIQLLARRKSFTDIIQQKKREIGDLPTDPAREAAILSKLPSPWLRGVFAAIFAASKQGYTGI